MSKEAYGENGDMIVVPEMEERCIFYHHFHPFHHHHPLSWLAVQITSPLHLKIIRGIYDLEWNTCSGVRNSWGRLVWESGLADTRLLNIKFSQGGGGGGGVIHKETLKWVNGGKIEAMFTPNHFIDSQNALLVVSNHCVFKKKYELSQRIYIYIYWKSYGLGYLSFIGVECLCYGVIRTH